MLAAALTNAAFVGLGAVFEYPDVLQQPAAEVLEEFRADEAVIVALFTLLAFAAGLLAPISVLVGRLAGGPLGEWSIRVGVAAAAVQVIGLLRWPLIVPWLAGRDASGAFELVNALLGTAVGETFGYLLTAAWTVLVVRALGRRIAGRWFETLGLSAAALIAVGVFVPLDVPGADLANFVGYIVLSVWLLAFAALLWRRAVPAQSQSAVPAGHPVPAPAP